MADMNNQDIERNIEIIRNALGNPDGCKVSYGLKADMFYYIIEPQEGQKEVRISVINNVVHDSKSIHLFQAFDIAFEKCNFENKVSLKGNEIFSVLDFENCIFEKIVDFSESIFQQHVSFRRVIFRDGIFFCKTTFKGEADFEDSYFHGSANFLETTFEQRALFLKTIFSEATTFLNSKFLADAVFSHPTFPQEAISQTTFEQSVSFYNVDFYNANFDNVEFHGEANFSVATFKMETSFSNSIFKKDIQFERTTFNDYVHFDGAEFGDSTKPIEEKSKYIANFLKATFNSGANFSNAHFYIPADFPNATFANYTNFNETEFVNEANFLSAHFEGGAYFTGGSFKKNTCFVGVTFHGNANFDQVEFQVGEDCESESNADFSGAHFQKTAELNATFGHDANFKGAIFDDNAYFDGAIFQGKTNFNLCHFYQSTYFYGAIFQNISQYETLKDIPFYQTNFHGDVYLSSDLFDFDFEHLQIIIDQDKDNERSETKTNKLRQMFRGVKSSFIEEHNYLNAAHYHKMELYCKEIELGYRKDENVEKSGIRDIVDRIQLYCYRITSDHHTDLLLILNNVLGLIVLFGAFVCGLCCFASYDTKCIDYECCASAEVYYLHSLMINSFCVDCNIWNIFCLEAFLIMLVCCAFVVAFILLVFFFNYVNSICRELGYWFIAFFVFVLFILAVKPAIMLPIFGKLIDESLKIDFPAFTSLSIVYAILMFLLVFSLQKTARKNTIVPN